jgi:hypothetical protein
LAIRHGADQRKANPTRHGRSIGHSPRSGAVSGHSAARLAGIGDAPERRARRQAALRARRLTAAGRAPLPAETGQSADGGTGTPRLHPNSA